MGTWPSVAGNAGDEETWGGWTNRYKVRPQTSLPILIKRHVKVSGASFSFACAGWRHLSTGFSCSGNGSDGWAQQVNVDCAEAEVLPDCKYPSSGHFAIHSSLKFYLLNVGCRLLIRHTVLGIIKPFRN